MINKIGPKLSLLIKSNDKNNNKYTTSDNNNSNAQNPLIDKEFANSYKSYAINFTSNDNPSGKKMTKEENILYYSSDSAVDLIQNAKKIAQENGQSEVSHYHILKVALIQIASVIKLLDDENVDYNSLDKNSTITLFETYTTDSMFSDKDSRKKASKVIQKKIKEVDKLIKKLPKDNVENKNNKILSDGLVSDIWSLRENETSQIDEYNIVGSAIYAKNKEEIRKFTNSLIYELNDALMIESKPIKGRPSFRNYNEKAKNVLKNLSLGTNMYVTFDPKKNLPKYFIPSLYNVLTEEKNGFGSINANNTVITEFNTSVKNDFFCEKVRNLAKDKTKTHIIMLYPSNLLMNSASPEEELNNIYAFRENYMNLMKNTPSNIKFIFFDSKDNLYTQLQNPIIQNMYQNFEEASIPVLSTEQIIKEFKEQPLLMKEIKKPFTKKALEKTVETSAQLDGIFPDKTQRLMKKIVSYYINKKEIGEADVSNYVKEAKDLFKKTNDDSSVDVIFDTGKRIKDIIGKESTKKEAMSLVRQLKSNRMGTKGVIMYSQDMTAGSGRRFTAQSIAGEARVPYVEINASYFGSENVDIFGGKVLSPENAMKKVFSLVSTQADANPNKSAVLFIENFDCFSLGEYLNRYHQRAMAQLINEMEKADKAGLNILVAGSISRADLLGEVAMKSFKFVDNIEISSPANNSRERAEIIEKSIKDYRIKLAAKTPEERTNIINSIANITEGASFMQLKNLVLRAQSVALERRHRSVQKDDFTEAFLQISTGRPATNHIEEHEKLVTSSHEFGHATNLEIMNQMIKKHGKPWQIPDKVNFVTLDPRGIYGGAMFYGKDKNNAHSFEKLFSNIVCSYGGNSAESKFFGMDGSLGISQDLQQATYYSESMVKMMGLGKNTGKIGIYKKDSELSPRLRESVDKDMDIILKNASNASDFITEAYADFNKKLVEKYAPLVGTGDCLIDGDTFRKELAEWKLSQSPEKQEELELVDKILWDIMEKTKYGNLYV